MDAPMSVCRLPPQVYKNIKYMQLGASPCYSAGPCS